MSAWLPTVVAGMSALAAVIVAVITGRSALAAQRLQAENNRQISEATQKNDAGKLALAIAMATRAEHLETRRRLDAHEAWREELVNEWWPEHDRGDRALEREVVKLDPTYVPPPRQPLPRLKRPTPGPSASPPASPA